MLFGYKQLQPSKAKPKKHIISSCVAKKKKTMKIRSLFLNTSDKVWEPQVKPVWKLKILLSNHSNLFKSNTCPFHRNLPSQKGGPIHVDFTTLYRDTDYFSLTLAVCSLISWFSCSSSFSSLESLLSVVFYNTWKLFLNWYGLKWIGWDHRSKCRVLSILPKPT